MQCILCSKQIFNFEQPEQSYFLINLLIGYYSDEFLLVTVHWTIYVQLNQRSLIPVYRLIAFSWSVSCFHEGGSMLGISPLSLAHTRSEVWRYSRCVPWCCVRLSQGSLCLTLSTPYWNFTKCVCTLHCCVIAPEASLTVFDTKHLGKNAQKTWWK